jgi:hypothetical protein
MSVKKGQPQPRADHPCPRNPPTRQPVTRADNTRHLLQAAADRHHDALNRARTAIDTLDRRGESITFTTVAHEAAVSRSWLYRQADLRDTIVTLRTDRRATAPLLPAGQRSSADSLRQRLDGLRAEIANLRDDLADEQHVTQPRLRGATCRIETTNLEQGWRAGVRTDVAGRPALALRARVRHERCCFPLVLRSLCSCRGTSVTRFRGGWWDRLRWRPQRVQCRPDRRERPAYDEEERRPLRQRPLGRALLVL